MIQSAKIAERSATISVHTIGEQSQGRIDAFGEFARRLGVSCLDRHPMITDVCCATRAAVAIGRFFLDQFEDCKEFPAWLSQEDLDYFVGEFSRNGFRGPLNWYRNLDRNWELSAAFAGQTIAQPAAFISGDRDLIRGMPGWEERMREVVTDLREVTILEGIGHWTQQEAAAETNTALLKFLESL